VEDTGIGISEEQGKKLFQAFGQAEAGTSRKFGGTGLGLTISAKLVELLGGELKFESEYGKGTTFFFDLAFKALMHAEMMDSAVVATSKSEPDAEKKALVAVDGIWSKQVLEAWLKSQGIVAVVASDAAALSGILKQEKIDLMLYDIDWQGEAGRKLLDEVAEHKSKQDIPLILLGTMAKVASNNDFIQISDGILSRPLQHAAFFKLLETSLYGESQAAATPEAELLKEGTMLGESLPMNILVADDDEINQMVAMRRFANLGFQPDFADNGLEVVEMCEATTYDVVFMDVNMPEMDGLEATRKLHEKFSNGKRPVIIAMTANAMEGDRESCLQAGMDDYMSKPFRVDELEEMLMKYGLQKNKGANN
ncbi:MAG: response regulator, partial [Bacteroidota bacterium]